MDMYVRMQSCRRVEDNTLIGEGNTEVGVIRNGLQNAAIRLTFNLGDMHVTSAEASPPQTATH